MTKEEYIKKKKSIEDQIFNLQWELKNIQSDYVNSNRQYKDGTKVVIENQWGKDRQTAFIDGYVLSSFTDNVIPTFSKMKKDGTQSKMPINEPWAGWKILKVLDE